MYNSHSLHSTVINTVLSIFFKRSSDKCFAENIVDWEENFLESYKSLQC